MAYSRYIKVGGKVYGPYEYSSYRKDGKVVSEYHGKGNEAMQEKIEKTQPILPERTFEPVQKPAILQKLNEEEEVIKMNFKPFLIAGILIFLIAAYFILPAIFTGKTASSLELDKKEWNLGETLTGTFNFNIQNKEISDSAFAVIKLGDDVKRINYKEFLSLSGYAVEDIETDAVEEVTIDIAPLELVPEQGAEELSISIEDNGQVIAEASEEIIVEEAIEEPVAEEEKDKDKEKKKDEVPADEIPVEEPVAETPIVNETSPEEETNIIEQINETIVEAEPEINITESINETLPENNTEFIEINESINLENLTEIITENATETKSKETKVFPEKTLRHKVVLGKSVKWKKIVNLTKEEADSEKIIIDIPMSASNVDVGKIVDGTEEKVENVIIDGKDAENYNGASLNLITGQATLKIYDKSFFEKIFEFIKVIITGKAIEDISEVSDIELEKVEVEINDEFEEGMEIEIEYETPAPWAEETETEKGKQIVINSIVHYQDILAFTEINNVSKDMINLYWINEDGKERVNEIDYVDDNEDGLIESIEWIVPSLSSQTYELVIEIVKAEHLDSNRNFISDIYNEVKEKDDVWSETINNNEYARIVFEQSLDSSRDITIYARGSASIEIYEKDEDELIATMNNINEEGYYKAYLANLQNVQDTFDLKVLGNIEIDYVVDPETNVTLCSNLDTADTYYTLNQSISANGTCINITAQNIVLDCQGYTIQGNYSSGSIGVNATNILNATIKNCIIQQGEYGVYLENSSGSLIQNNTFLNLKDSATGVNVSAVYLRNTNNSRIYSNNVSGLNGSTGASSSVSSIASGIILSLSSYNNISNNSIEKLIGGAGASLGPGGIASGILLVLSTNNTLYNNTMNDLAGGAGGAGGTYDSAGTGGMGAGIYLREYSTENNITYSNISYSKGGSGGAAGANSQSGADQKGFGIYIKDDSLNNYIDSTNFVGNDTALYFYNKIGMRIENYTLTSNLSSTNLGKIVLINCSGFSVFNNTIFGFTGYSGETNTTRNAPGEIGAIGAGIYLRNSTETNVTRNTISFIYGGTGGTGGFDLGGGGEMGRGGIGGLGAGIYINASINNNITNNTIYSVYGGTGGKGGDCARGGDGGIGAGIYLQASNNTNVTYGKTYSMTAGSGGAGGKNYQCDYSYSVGGYAGKGIGIMLNLSSYHKIEGINSSINNYGIYFDSSNSSIIEDSSAESNTISGIYLSLSSNNQIINTTTKANTYGIDLNSSSNNQITNITSTGDTYGIYMQSSLDNRVDNSTTNGGTSGIYLHLSNYSNITNVISTGSTYGVYASFSSYNSVVNSTMNVSNSGAYLSSSDYNNITNSNINASTYPVYLSSSTYNHIVNVTATNNTVAGTNIGIYLLSSSNNEIRGCNSTSKIGLQFQSSSYNNLIDSNITGLGGDGISMYPSSDYNNITNCIVRGVGYAVDITSGADSNRLVSSVFYGTTAGIEITPSAVYPSANNNWIINSTINGTKGIIHGSASNNVIDGCNITSNDYGIYLLDNFYSWWMYSDNFVVNNSRITSDGTGFFASNEYGTSASNSYIDNCNITANEGINISSDSNIYIKNIIVTPVSRGFVSLGRKTTVVNLTFNGTYPTKVSFAYNGNITINLSKGIADDSGLRNISKYLNMTNTSLASVSLNISYEDSDVISVSESKLMMYKHNGTNWTLVSGSAVDTAKNIVYGNVTDFNNRIIAPLADIENPAIIFSCSPLSVDVGGTITCSCTATDNIDTSPSLSYSINPSTSSSGTYTTTCTATDDSGNTASSSVTYLVNPIGGEVTPPCTPSTCSSSGKSCGSWSDGCGGTIDCGTCSAGYECSAGNCVLISPACTNDCSSGAKECVTETSFKTCGNYDADSCLEWSSSTSCEAGKTCQNGVCISETPTCSNECSPNGKSECIDGISFQVCGNYDADACLEWGSSTSCDINTEECSAGACVPKPCISQWSCGEWGECELTYSADGVEGLQERSCTDLAECEDEQIETQSCEIQEVDIDIEVEEVNGETLTTLSDPVSGGYIGTIKKGEREGKPYVDIVLLEPLEGIPKRLKEIPKATITDYFKSYVKWMFLILLLVAWMFTATFFRAYMAEVMPQMPAPELPKMPAIPAAIERIKEDAELIKAIQKAIPEITLEGLKEKESRKIERKIKSRIKEFKESKEIEELKRQLQMIESELAKLRKISISGSIEHKIDLKDKRERIEKHLEKSIKLREIEAEEPREISELERQLIKLEKELRELRGIDIKGAIEHKIELSKEKERIERSLEKLKARKIEIRESREMSDLELQLKRLKESLMSLDRMHASDSYKVYDFEKVKEKIDRHVDKGIKAKEIRIKESESIKKLRHELEQIFKKLKELSYQ